MTLISIVMPVWNGAQTISRAIDSVLEQTYPDFEVLVVDDGSTDQTSAIIQSYVARDSRILYIKSDKNHGVSHARNLALAQVKGEWVTLLDADDWYAPDRLAQMLGVAKETHADVVIDNMHVINHETEQKIGQTVFGKKDAVVNLTPRELFERDTPFSLFALGYAQPMVRASVLREKAIRYNEAFALGEDFVFLADILLYGATAYITPYAGYYYDMARPPLFSALDGSDKPNRSYQHILAASDGLLMRFRDVMSSDVKAALLRRQKLFGLLVVAREVKFFIKKRAWRGVFAKILYHPKVVPFIARMMILRFFSTDFIGA